MTIPAYTIRNAAATIVATINPATTTGVTFPIEMPGAGFPQYGEFWNQNVYRLMENFAKPTAPSNPAPGMLWYNSTTKVESYWDGTEWRALSGESSGNSVAFPMMVAAATLDLATAATTTIFTPVGAKVYYPTAMILLPVVIAGVFTAPATINLYKTASEDIMENAVTGTPNATKFGNYPLSGFVERVSGASTIKFVVSSAMTGTGITATYKAILFGYIN